MGLGSGSSVKEGQALATELASEWPMLGAPSQELAGWMPVAVAMVAAAAAATAVAAAAAAAAAAGGTGTGVKAFDVGGCW